MTSAFGFKFVKSFGERDTGVWFEALKDLSKRELAYGFRKTLRDTSDVDSRGKGAWPPNVKEFRAHCKSWLSDLGIPSVHTAFREYASAVYCTHPVFSHAIVGVLAERMGEVDERVNRGAMFLRFQAEYKNTITELLNKEN